MSQPQTWMNDAVTELVALAGAVAANCEPCFRAHYDRARKLGVSMEDMRKAVETGLAVKAIPQRSMAETVGRFLATGGPREPGSCCNGTSRTCC